ncbi:XRE family transcriptional regulator [Enterocloster clostridioformis]|uniref:XRE family transcriptional regulator n=1 Tax=Enterocloster clostridioformis TaxID=1531 RepID=UPI001FA72CC1|nr:XRE family transcriptional regulator [Enterocloster clostridioformis]
MLAGSREPDFDFICKVSDGLGICVRELRADEDSYAVSVKKDTLAKLIVVSELNGMELDVLLHVILEKGIEEYGFYE